MDEKVRKWFTRELPEIDWAAIKHKPGVATRAASATVLGELANQVDNMVVASADLSNSDKTDGFLKQTKVFAKGDFTGAFLQAGVSEFTMSCLCIGMSLHGGVIPACGTFFCVLRLYETLHSDCCFNANTCNFYLDTRCFSCRRRWPPHSSTGRAGSTDSSTGEVAES